MNDRVLQQRLQRNLRHLVHQQGLGHFPVNGKLIIVTVQLQIDISPRMLKLFPKRDEIPPRLRLIFINLDKSLIISADSVLPSIVLFQ